MKKKVNSRAKGAAGEREFISALTDILGDALTAPMKRNLEQTRAGGHDIVGLEGWAIEVKRYKKLTEGELDLFWQQAWRQAEEVGAIPALAYREDFRSWRARVPLELLLTGDWTSWPGVEWTADLSLDGFASVVREHLRSDLHADKPPERLPSNSDEACASTQ